VYSKNMPMGVYKKTNEHKEKIRKSIRRLFKNYTIDKRFFNKVKKTKNCWFWIGATNKKEDGYGLLWIKRKRNLAHRISWKIHNGFIPKNKLVLHKCDIKLCVNPKHLFIGSQKDNMEDMFKKHRNAIFVGEDNKNHKLTDKQVKEIRRKYIPWKYSMYKLGREYKVSAKSCILAIIQGRTWKHI